MANIVQKIGEKLGVGGGKKKPGTHQAGDHKAGGRGGGGIIDKVKAKIPGVSSANQQGKNKHGHGHDKHGASY